MNEYKTRYFMVDYSRDNRECWCTIETYAASVSDAIHDIRLLCARAGCVFIRATEI